MMNRWNGCLLVFLLKSYASNSKHFSACKRNALLLEGNWPLVILASDGCLARSIDANTPWQAYRWLIKTSESLHGLPVLPAPCLVFFINLIFSIFLLLWWVCLSGCLYSVWNNTWHYLLSSSTVVYILYCRSTSPVWSNETMKLSMWLFVLIQRYFRICIAGRLSTCKSKAHFISWYLSKDFKE
jgi:hypothetical protein